MSIRRTSLLGDDNLTEEKTSLDMSAQKNVAERTGSGSSGCGCVHTISPQWLKTEMSAGLLRQKGKHCDFGVMLRRWTPGKETLALVTCWTSLFRSLFPGSFGTLLVILARLQMAWKLVHTCLRSSHIDSHAVSGLVCALMGTPGF